MTHAQIVAALRADRELHPEVYRKRMAAGYDPAGGSRIIAERALPLSDARSTEDRAGAHLTGVAGEPHRAGSGSTPTRQPESDPESIFDGVTARLVTACLVGVALVLLLTGAA